MTNRRTFLAGALACIAAPQPSVATLSGQSCFRLVNMHGPIRASEVAVKPWCEGGYQIIGGEDAK